MNNLNSINTSVFGNCTINEFDAPNLNKITGNYFKFTVGEKNFRDSQKILKKIDCPNEEPDYEQLIQKLPKECFECESANLDNYKLFIVDNTIVFPDNIINV